MVPLEQSSWWSSITTTSRIPSHLICHEGRHRQFHTLNRLRDGFGDDSGPALVLDGNMEVMSRFETANMSSAPIGLNKLPEKVTAQQDQPGYAIAISVEASRQGMCFAMTI